MSSELRLILAPRDTYAALARIPDRGTVRSALRRPLLVALVPGAADRGAAACAGSVLREPRAVVAVDARRGRLGAVPDRPAVVAGVRHGPRADGPDAADDRGVLPRSARDGS